MEYSADLGQENHDERATNKGPNLKICKDFELAAYIEKKISKDKYSPEAVIREIKVKGLKFKTSLFVKTIIIIYRMICFMKLVIKIYGLKEKGIKESNEKFIRYTEW